jgi:RHH-type transcriptional regulator, rel operon repressor / antitoxin RelB
MYSYVHKLTQPNPGISMSSTMTIRLDDDVKQRLELLSEATHRSKSYLAAEAIRDFINLNEWQISEIKEALEEADKEDFASEEEVSSIFKKWNK